MLYALLCASSSVTTCTAASLAELLSPLAAPEAAHRWSEIQLNLITAPLAVAVAVAVAVEVAVAVAVAMSWSFSCL